MLFQYVGSGDKSPETCDIFDHFFVLNGEPVDVKNEFVIKKLMNNGSFIYEKEQLKIDNVKYNAEEE